MDFLCQLESRGSSRLAGDPIRSHRIRGARPPRPSQREDIRRIKRAVNQLTSIINDILNFAKLEAGEVRVDIGLVHIEEALANASAIMEPQAAAKGVQFTYTPCDTSIFALADRERVQQIILNLLSNAVKYTDTGGKVQMACLCKAGTVRVRVTDTGRGMDGDITVESQVGLGSVFEIILPAASVDISPSMYSDGNTELQQLRI